MKVYKVHFNTQHGLSLFGEISEILEESKVLGLNVRFHSGGWDQGATDYYHEWKGVDDVAIMQNFLESQYGDSLNTFSHYDEEEVPEEEGQEGADKRHN